MANGSKDMTLHPDNYTTDGARPMAHGVQCVGQVSFLFQHPYLDALADQDPDFASIKGGVFLTGFKLEQVLLSADQQIDNAKLIPLLNGDTMTLTNACKAGTLSFACTRTAAGIKGGDLVSIMDFIRTQGDSNGGSLTVSWFMNGDQKQIEFKNACCKRCPPLMLAGNDLPDYNIQITYATYADSDYPKITI